MNKLVVGMLIWCSLGGTKAETYKISAYCPGKCCCGAYADGFTSTGMKALARNRVVAVDKRKIPMHSMVNIVGLGSFRAEDVGGAIKGNRIDLLFDTHQEALEFGVKEMKVMIVG